MSLSKSMVLLWLGGVLLVLLVASPVAKVHAESDEEEENSSSEVTVEESDEDGSQAFPPIPNPQSRRRRNTAVEEFQPFDGLPRKANVARAIPGLPDIGALIKVAEFLRTVGEQIVPILIEGILKLNPRDKGANSQHTDEDNVDASDESAPDPDKGTGRDGLLLSLVDGLALRRRQRLARFFGILRDIRRDARET